MNCKETSGLKIGTVIKYTVRGVDDEGEFEVVRRFKEFYQLHASLNERWPGCYIPGVPPKSAFDNKIENFIEKRRAMLERFMQELSKYKYLVHSPEFKMFARQEGEIDSALQKLPRQTPTQILDKYRLIFKVDEGQDLQEINAYQEKIIQFQAFLNRAVGPMTNDKKAIEAAKKAFGDSYAHQRQILNAFKKFEETAVEFYAAGDQSHKTFVRAPEGSLEETYDSSCA